MNRKVSTILIVIFIVLPIFYCYLRYRSIVEPPKPEKIVEVAVYAERVNDTGTITEDFMLVVGVEVVISNSSGVVAKIITNRTYHFIYLYWGHWYNVTAKFNNSVKWENITVGGYGGTIEILVWDNDTIKSIEYIPTLVNYYCNINVKYVYLNMLSLKEVRMKYVKIESIGEKLGLECSG